MRVLVVKTSSLGDVVHTLPALTDAMRAVPGIRFDWVVEEAFAEIPGWHPAVDRVIPVAIRRWRKQLWQTLRSGEWTRFTTALRAARYDLVIDAQGLMKSAWLTRQVSAPRAGYDRHSIREPLASLAYDRRFAVSREQHAVERIRHLFALALGYDKPSGTGDYGLTRGQFAPTSAPQRRVMFLHGTTWPTKLWPEPYWQALCKQVVDAGYAVTLPWGNVEERERAERIASVASGAVVLPRLNLRALASELASSAAVVAVDTGLGHLAAALNIPALSLYGPTRPALVGAYGANQIHLTASSLPPVADAAITPQAMAALTPAVVWQELSAVLAVPLT
ncbi:MAG: lipopolysaccharide heptosyltransferase I [Spongiibacteraceae bacterium]